MKVVDVYPTTVTLDPHKVPAELWDEIVDQLGLSKHLHSGDIKLEVHQVTY